MPLDQVLCTNPFFNVLECIATAFHATILGIKPTSYFYSKQNYHTNHEMQKVLLYFANEWVVESVSLSGLIQSHHPMV